jgi:hypothetical protein
MGCGERRKCKCCRELFRPDLGNRTHRYYQLGVGLLWRPARLRARRAGSPSPRTEITSAAQCTSPEFQNRRLVGLPLQHDDNPHSTGERHPGRRLS